MKNKSLFEIADNQQGFFTAKQAIKCGISSKNHAYFVKTGKWIKEGRGLYRLSNYPIVERPDLMRLYLWSRNSHDIPQGVFSHSTALMIYDLSDVMPEKIYMTVPKNFKRRSKIPEILQIHKKNLLKEDIRYYLDVKVTTPIRTIIDIIEENLVSKELIYQAIQEALSRGLIISKNKILEHPYLIDNKQLKKQVEKYL
ncbi:MAG: type IV toxin-antitoxin system AbiEi family antitoxin domain-containing protein [Parachlamydiales bacterium]|nr:type IV toxin-antitoxin system AbiEi family antitoxin domain-containing protein [Parachlamydiales bacterium]